MSARVRMAGSRVVGELDILTPVLRRTTPTVSKTGRSFPHHEMDKNGGEMCKNMIRHWLELPNLFALYQKI
jgi:hypothetical protein